MRGDFKHNEATEQSYRYSMVDEDTALIEFECTTNHDTVSNRDKKLYISRDWIQNLDFLPKKVLMWDSPFMIHRGFFQNWISVRDEILNFIYERKPSFIVIRGFSQGASMSVVAYQDISFHNNRDFGGKLFVGATAYEPAKVFYGKDVPKLTACNLVITRNDPVCWMPPFTKHVGTKINIGKWWRFWPIQHYPEQVGRALDEVNELGDYNGFNF
jgi:hypothetical protein